MRRKTLRRQFIGTMLIVIMIFYLMTVVFTICEMEELVDTVTDQYNQYTQFENGKKRLSRLDMEEEITMLGGFIHQSRNHILMYICFNAVLALMIAIAVAGYRTRKLLEPLYQLEDQMNEVGQGHLDRKIEVQADNEFVDLADRFNDMLVSLREYMEDLKQTTADKERLSAELKVMRRIQKDMLPSRYPSRGDMQLYAAVWPWSEGGGDYYDFFWVDGDHLAITLGDTTEVGIMATLYAVLAQTHMRSFGMMGYAPNRILAETNNQLSEKNEFGMNVAAFAAIIQLSSGEVSYSSAGMEPFLWKHAGGDAEPVEDAQVTIPLGNMENVPYHNHKRHFPGEGFVGPQIQCAKSSGAYQRAAAQDLQPQGAGRGDLRGCAILHRRYPAGG